MARGNFKRFSRVFKNALKSKGYTLEKLSKESGIPIPTLGNYSSGANAPTAENRVTIKKILGLHDADFLEDVLTYTDAISSRGGMELREVAHRSKRRAPVVSWALAGEAKGRGYFEDLASQIDHTVETTSRDPNAFAIEISGDSMEPLVSPSDVVVFEPNMEPTNGMPVLVKLIDGRVFFKRLYRTQSKIVLQSENAEYPDMEFEQSEIAFVYPARDIHRTARSRPKRI